MSDSKYLNKPDSDIIRHVSEKSGKIDQLIAKRKKKEQEGGGAEEGLGDQQIELKEHMMPVEAVEKLHETSLKHGLDEKQVQAKQELYGLNMLTPPPSKHWFLVFLSHMAGFFSLLLWGAGILCFIAYALDTEQPENMYLGVVLVVVVFLTGCFSYYQDAKSASVMEGFKNYLPPETSVLRNGKNTTVEAKELVPGDIVSLKNGDKVPADMRVVKASNFKVDNASLTGESLPQKRTHENTHENPLEATNMAFFGTLVVNGKATGIIVQTGDNTVIGTIAKLASSTDNKQTPIAEEIERFIRIISGVAIFLGVTFLIIGVIKGTEPIENVVFCIGIIVANVPEGLLATVTVSLTLTAQRMAEKKVLVKNLESVETLGSTSVIASDKTGTLTQNKMIVAHLWYDNKVYLAHGQGSESFKKDAPSFQLLRMCITLCNNAVFVDKPTNMAKPIMQRLTEGDASESSFIKFSEGIDNTGILNMRKKHQKVGEVPFNSANKYQITIHCFDGDWEKPRILMMKGAPERVWERCDSVLVDGQKVLKEEVEEQYQAALFRLMNGGERVLGCCMAELDPQQFPKGFEYAAEEPYNFPVTGLTFLGLISMIDPPRQAVPGAVLSCQTAGIKVIMVTGDHPDTAEAIAKQVHIIRDKTRRDLMVERKLETLDDVKIDDPEIEAQVITGDMLLTMNKTELDEILDYQQIVFARTSPQQKLIIVEGLQRKEYQRRGYEKPKRVRHVVAVTGDGVNDSPALKAANIGVAMGVGGSEVAKDAADMILLNDNFASIVDGVEEGRLIFDNLKKSIAYTLSSNIPEISPFLVNILVGIPLPLPVVLILCIDLGTDMLPAISLAYENKESDIMQRPPRDSLTDRLVTVKLISFSYLQIGIIQALAGFFCYFVVLHDFGFEPNVLPNNQDIFDDDNESDLVFSSNPLLDSSPLDVSRTVSFEGETITMIPCTIERRGVCHVPSEALAYAQTSFFVSIVIVQWADILCCKTRTLSLKHQGMRNGTLNFGLFFETVLAIGLCYIPGLDSGLGTRPINFVHWLPALPFSMIILSYDEIRKYFMRTWGKDNWLERNTFY